MVRHTSKVKAFCPVCHGKRGFHTADCTAAEQEKDAYIARMRGIRDRLEALGICADDLIEFIDFCNIKNNFG